MHKYTPSVAAAILALGDWGSSLMGYQNETLAWVFFLAIVILLGYGIFLNNAYLKSLFWYGLSKGTRIPLLDFYKIAEKRGWDFKENSGLPALGFAAGLRQAGIDGAISMWGRPIHSVQDLTKWELLLPIKRNRWENHEIDALYLFRMSTNGQIVGLKKSNSHFRTKTRPGGADQRNYADLHIDRKQALKWLKWEADKYKDMYEESDGNWSVS